MELVVSDVLALESVAGEDGESPFADLAVLTRPVLPSLDEALEEAELASIRL